MLPVVTAVAMFAVASSDGSLSVDFQNELYPEAERLLRWENPFPPPGSDLSHGHNLIWPPFAALVAAPFTLLSPAAANWAIALVGLACFMASLRLVGVRDWRVYGVFALWPQVIGEIRVSHLTPFLCLLLALAWRYRDARAVPGVALGCAAAIKFFLWPLGVWLAAIGRAREALIAAGVAAASLLLVLPFTSLHDYFTVLLDLGRTFDNDSYSPFGLLVAARRVRGSRADRDRRPRRGAPRRLLAEVELRPGRGRRARALPHRVARLLRSRRDTARGRSAAAFGGLVRTTRDLGSPQRRDRRGDRMGRARASSGVRARHPGDGAHGAPDRDRRRGRPPRDAIRGCADGSEAEAQHWLKPSGPRSRLEVAVALRMLATP